MVLLRVSVAVVNVGVRSDRGEELAAILGEDQVAGPVAAAAQASAAGQVGQVFRGAAGLQIAIFIGEAHDAVGIADVDILRIGSRGIERDAEWLVQAFGENGGLLRLAVAVTPRKTRILPAALSARKRSPLGAMRSRRGLSRPVA